MLDLLMLLLHSMFAFVVSDIALVSYCSLHPGQVQLLYYYTII